MDSYVKDLSIFSAEQSITVSHLVSHVSGIYIHSFQSFSFPLKSFLKLVFAATKLLRPSESHNVSRRYTSFFRAGQYDKKPCNEHIKALLTVIETTFQQVSTFLKCQELVHGQEGIVDAIEFAWARTSRRA